MACPHPTAFPVFKQPSYEISNQPAESVSLMLGANIKLCGYEGFRQSASQGALEFKRPSTLLTVSRMPLRETP